MNISHPPAIGHERILSDVISTILSEKVAVFYSGTQKLCNQLWTWVQLEKANQKLRLAVSQVSMAQTTLAIAAALRSKEGFQVVEPEDTEIKEVDCYLVIDQNSKVLTKILLQSVDLQLGNSHSSQMSMDAFSRERLSISCLFPLACVDQHGLELRYDEIHWKFESQKIGAIQCELNRSTSCLQKRQFSFTRIKETTMSNTIAFELALGEFSIPEADFVKLRPGSELQTHLPEKIEGILKIHGQAFAIATVTFNNDGMKVQLMRFAGDLSPDHETISSIERTLYETQELEAI